MIHFIEKTIKLAVLTVKLITNKAISWKIVDIVRFHWYHQVNKQYMYNTNGL
jgi:hypothetical protein